MSPSAFGGYARADFRGFENSGQQGFIDADNAQQLVRPAAMRYIEHQGARGIGYVDRVFPA